jgi:predicted MFS family arabinose efflux permease
MAVIGDVFPSEKRGRASGAVVSSFAVASIVGLPVGLLMVEWFGRGAPFYAVAALSTGVWAVGWVRLPNVREHLHHARPHPLREFVTVAREANHLWAFAFTFFMVLGTFTVASFIGPVIASVNGWTEQTLAVFYFFAGLFTLAGMTVVGRLSDRLPRLPLFRVLAFGSLVMAVVVSNLPPGPVWVATLAMGGFMVLASGRIVPAQAMLLGTAAAKNRGAFMSLNTAVQHVASGLAPAIAGAIVHVGEDGKLTGFPLVGLVSAATAAVSLVLAGRLTAASHVAVMVEPIVEAKVKEEPAAA